MADVDGFTLVTNKRKGKSRSRHSIPYSKIILNTNFRPNNIDKDGVKQQVLECQKEIDSSDYYRSIKCVFQEIAPLAGFGNIDIQTIVCYGIGSFADCLIARYQLGLLLCLWNLLQVDCFVYDPIFSTTEKAILEDLHIKLININEEGKRNVHQKTLFYMPHCGKALYNNVLWANWGPSLSKIIILGNSFTRITESLPRRVLENQIGYMLRIFKYSKEVSMPNIFKFPDIFNNTSFHFFPRENLLKLTQDFWEDNAEPVYDECDELIINNSCDTEEIIEPKTTSTVL